MDQFLIAGGEKLGAFLTWAANPISQMLLVPLVGCLLLCACKATNLRLIRGIAVTASLLTLLITILMVTGAPESWRGMALGNADGPKPWSQYQAFVPNAPGMQFTLPADQYVWLKVQFGENDSFSVNWNVGVDGLSMPLLLLCSGLFFLATLWALRRKERVREFFALFLLLQLGISGVFISLDYILFYLFWEIMLLPMYFLISGFGKDRAISAHAAIKFFLFTMGGSVFFLISAIAMQIFSGVYSFSIIDILLASVGDKMAFLPLFMRSILFIGLLLAFAVKLPLFPLHTWLPDAHTEAPTEVSVILAGIMLKTGGYAMLRILYPSLPDAAYIIGPILATCAVISIVYGAAVTLVQTDFKRMVAYSSISHMGFVALGICVMNADATVGAVFHMVAHGVIIATLFFLSGVIERLYGTRDMRQISGLAKRAPWPAAVLVIAALASMGMPFLAGFWGEFNVLKGAFYNNANWETVRVGLMDASSYLQLLAFIACIGILVTAVYMLRMINKVVRGEPGRQAFAGGDKAPVIAQPVMIAGTEPKTAEQTLAWATLGASSPMAETLRLREVELSGSGVAAGLATHDGEYDEEQQSRPAPRPSYGGRLEDYVLFALAATLVLLFLFPNWLLNAPAGLATTLSNIYKVF